MLSNYCEVTYRIEVPEALTVRVDARDAQVTVRDLRGAVDVATTNDVVRADSLSGEVSLESSNDDVLASGMGPGAVRIVTSNARVEAGFSEPPARVEIQTSNDAAATCRSRWSAPRRRSRCTTRHAVRRDTRARRRSR